MQQNMPFPGGEKLNLSGMRLENDSLTRNDSLGLGVWVGLRNTARRASKVDPMIALRCQ